MKQNKQLFSPAGLKKDITRFAPVWGLYTVFILMYLFLIWAQESTAARVAGNVPYILQSMGIVNFLYGGLCALVLFGDLFSSKLCNALHAMPVRREGWFLTHLVAGMLFCLVPNILCTAVAAVLLEEYYWMAFLWLGISVCQFLFFFGAAAFSIQCAGNRLGATAVYALINFLSTLVAFLADTFYLPLLHGIRPQLETMLRWSPPVGFTQSQYIQTKYDYDQEYTVLGQWIPADFRYLLIATTTGLLLLGGAVLLYRRRKMESAGDFIAVKPVAPIFLVVYTLCVGAVFYFLADLFAGETQYLFLLIGFAVGFFTGWMLLERKVQIFTLRRLLGFGALVLVLAVTVTATWLDPLGITRYVPTVEQVESLDISPYESDYYMETKSLKLTDPEEIAELLSIHQALTQKRDLNQDSYGFCLRLRYQLKDGSVKERQYFLSGTDEHTLPLTKYFSRFSYITGAESIDQLLDGANTIEFNTYNDYYVNFDLQAAQQPSADEEIDPGTVGRSDTRRENWLRLTAKSSLAQNNLARELAQAVYSDCAMGKLSQVWELHNGDVVGELRIIYDDLDGVSQEVDLQVFFDSAHTANFLKSVPRKINRTDR